MSSIDDALRDTLVAAINVALKPLIEAVERLDNPDPVPGVWTLEQAAVRLGVSQITVRRWVARGVLPRLPETTSLLISKRAVEEFIDSGRAREADDPPDEVDEAV